MKITAPNGFVYFVAAVSVAASGAAETPKTKQIEPMQTVAPPPPAPAIPVERDSPAENARIQRAMQEIVTLDVEVTGGTERLWFGTMRINNQNSGDYTSSLRHAGPCADGDEVGRSYNGQQNQLTVNLRRAYNRDIDGFTIRVGWTHPRQECGTGGGQATVGFEQGFSLRPGASIQLAGDGGLSVKITRRR